MARERRPHVRVLYGSCKICNYGERGWGERKKTREARRQLEMNAGLSGCCSTVTCLLRGLARLWEGAACDGSSRPAGRNLGSWFKVAVSFEQQSLRSQGMRRASPPVRGVSRQVCACTRCVYRRRARCLLASNTCGQVREQKPIHSRFAPKPHPFPSFPQS